MSDEMDVSQFKEIFVSEAREHLSALNANLLELEKNPRGAGLINEVFRAAHTLKGMAATMGFDKVTELTHSMENVLDKLRSGKYEAKTETLDILFDCFDTLEALLEEIVSGQDKGVGVQSLVARLKAADLAQSSPAAGAAPAATPAAAPPAPSTASGTEPAPPPVSPEDGQKKNESNAVAETSEAGEVKGAAQDHKAQTVRIKVEHLDKLMNLVGELVIAKVQIAQIAEKERIAELSTLINGISQFTTELQEEVLKTRMVPVKYIFDRYPRMVRDLSHRLGKEIEFVMSGTEIEIDRMLLDQINEPLVHLLRNAVDHGIEPPDVRMEFGKPAGGTITLTARREKGSVWVEASDDGRGMDAAEIRQKAVEKGVIEAAAAATMTELESFMLICRPGFSLAKEITDVSGRGVGMDVVKNMVEAFNGKLDIKSRRGKGSTFIVQLPLSLAIIQALLVEVGAETYAIPLTNVGEIAKIARDYIKTIDNKQVLLLRDEVIPLVFLDAFFAVPKKGESTESQYAVIVEINDRRIGLVVDNMLGKQEIVIKTLSGILRSVKNFSGATILGDGSVVLIIDAISVC